MIAQCAKFHPTDVYVPRIALQFAWTSLTAETGSTEQNVSSIPAHMEGRARITGGKSSGNGSVILFSFGCILATIQVHLVQNLDTL